MRSNKIFYFSTSFAAFFMAVFMIGSINQSIVTSEKSAAGEPTVVSTYPSDGDTDVARNVVIEITFSEEMDSTSMMNHTFTLQQGTESVEGIMEFSGNKGMFTTQSSLKAETEYTAKITTDSDRSDNDYLNEEYNNEEFNDEESDYRTSAMNDKEWSFTTGGNSDPVETVDLGSAADYVILAQSSINNDSGSEITGEKGFNPDFKSSKKDKENKTAYWLNNEDVDKEAVRRDTTRKKDSGREKSDNREYTANEEDSEENDMDQALEDVITAYDDAAERTAVDFIDFKFVKSDHQEESAWNNNRDDDNEMISRDSTDATDVGLEEDYNTESEMEINTNKTSVTLEPGIYKWNESLEISTNITLAGSAEDVWIFQISEDLTVNRDVEMTLSDGAVAENIFWQVAGEVNLEEASHFEGIVLSLTAITMKSGASLNGRMLAQTDVTLDENTIIQPQILASLQRTSIDE
jgi:hypothetical protein